MSSRGVVAMVVGSIWMIAIAVMVVAGVSNAASVWDAAYRVLVAVGILSLAAFAFQTALNLREAESAADRRMEVPVPVPLRVKAER